jgi:RHS repeat-associated protein
VREHFEQMPFGEPWIEEQAGQDATPYRFTGKELDSETGLMYFGARYYDPRQAQWASVDPALGMRNDPRNCWVYTYGSNSPLVLVDPDGREEVDRTIQFQGQDINIHVDVHQLGSESMVTTPGGRPTPQPTHQFIVDAPPSLQGQVSWVQFLKTTYEYELRTPETVTRLANESVDSEKPRVRSVVALANVQTVTRFWDPRQNRSDPTRVVLGQTGVTRLDQLRTYSARNFMTDSPTIAGAEQVSDDWQGNHYDQFTRRVRIVTDFRAIALFQDALPIAEVEHRQVSQFVIDRSAFFGLRADPFTSGAHGDGDFSNIRNSIVDVHALPGGMPANLRRLREMAPVVQ